MKLKGFLLMLSLFFANGIYTEGSKRIFETLLEFEKLYDTIKPAQKKSKEAFVWFSGVPHPFLNAVLHLSCEDVTAKVDALITETSPSIPLSFWVHSENHAEGLVEVLKQRGFACMITCPLMTWSVKPLSTFKADVRPADRERFYDILSAVYQFDEGIKASFRKLMDNVKCENYLIYIDGKPIGSATLVVNGSIGGVFNDATLPQRREASLAMMQFLMQRSYELKLTQLIVLSSPEAEKLYGSLGFENVCNIEIYSR